LNQSVVFKAMARACVKAIAVRYGLGFSLWSKDEIEDQEDDDLYKHSLRSIEERVQQAYTRLVRKGMTTKQIAEALHKTEDEVRVIFSFFSQLDRFEQELLKL
jgi:DNA-binding NarL/FixJ family response regulator